MVHFLRRLAGVRPAVRSAAPVALASPPTISDDELLDRRGRPLRGAARTARIAAIERARMLASAAASPQAGSELVDKRGRPLRGAALAARRAAIEKRRAAVIAAAQLPAARPATRRPIALPALGSIRVPSFSVRALRLMAITMTMTFVFATVIGTTGLVNRRGTVALGASTTLTIISGEVTGRGSDAEEFHPIADGETLRAGMTIRTAADTYAVLTYFEGSTVSLDPGTTLVVEALAAEPDGSTIIAMRQEIGRTWHSVAKLLKAGSRYEVKTPTATATVRGTMFEVGVAIDPQGEVVSTVETTEGAVATSKAPTPEEPQPKEEVVVRPGFEVSITKSAPLPPPKPAPEPQRTVTVTVGAAAGIVLDPVGRANGIKDGKIVVQTPGAVVEKVDGKLVIKLPDIPDGRLATVVDPKLVGQAPVDVLTTVIEKGQPARTSDQKIEAAPRAGPTVAQVELRKGTPVQVELAAAEQKKIVESVKVAEPPSVGAVVPDLSANAGSEATAQKGRGEKRGGGPGGPGGAGGSGGGPPPGIATNAGAGPATGFVPLVEIPTLPSVVTVPDKAPAPAVADADDQSGAPVTRDSRPRGQGGVAPKGPDEPVANAPNGRKAGDPQRAADPQRGGPASQAAGNGGRVIEPPTAIDPARGVAVSGPGDAPRTGEAPKAVGGVVGGDPVSGGGAAKAGGGAGGPANTGSGGGTSTAGGGTGAANAGGGAANTGGGSSNVGGGTASTGSGAGASAGGSSGAVGGGAGGSSNAGNAGAGGGSANAGTGGGPANAGGGTGGGGPAGQAGGGGTANAGGGGGAVSAGGGAGGNSGNAGGANAGGGPANAGGGGGSGNAGGGGPSGGAANTGGVAAGGDPTSGGGGAPGRRGGGQVISDQPSDAGSKNQGSQRKDNPPKAETPPTRGGFVPDVSLPSLPSLSRGGSSGDDDHAPTAPSKDAPSKNAPSKDQDKGD